MIKNNKFVFTLVVSAAVVLTGGGLLIYQKSPGLFRSDKSDQETACTLEAKLCPDGSSVSRTGPNCEFAACPGEIDTSNWKTYRNEQYGFEVRYPPRFIFRAEVLPIVPAGRDFLRYELSHFDLDEEKYEKPIGAFTHSIGIDEGCSIVLSFYEKPFTPDIFTALPEPELRMVGGVQAYEISNYSIDSSEYDVYIPMANRIVIMAFLDCGNQQENNPLTYKDQILSTFKFIK